MTMTRAALILMLCAFAPGQPVGTFEAETTGVVSARLTGHASFRVSPSGEVFIVLAASTPSPVTVVMLRDAGGLPASEAAFEVGAVDCGDDEAPEIAQAADRFRVSARGGPALTPVWIAAAHRGTLTLSPAGDGIAGRFDLTACGENVESGDRVEMTLRGSFRAGRSR